MKLELLPNHPDFYDFIRQLRNDERVQPGFVQKVSITEAEQQVYMAKYHSHYFVCLADGQPAGYIGEIDGDIRLATHPSFQRIGVGRFMVTELLKRRPKIRARVKADNQPSLALFRSLGFVEEFVIFSPPPGKPDDPV